MTFRHFAAPLVFALAFACTESPTEPGFGTVQVSVRTEGGDADLDGYSVIVGSEARAIGPVHGTTPRMEVPAGEYMISIGDVAPNCVVSGEHPRSVRVGRGQAVDVSFVVDCAPTGLEIIASASGQNIPQTVAVSVGGATLKSVSPGVPLLVTRLQPGAQVIRLLQPEHCDITGASSGKETSATVVNRAVTRVTLDVACGPVIRREKIAFVRIVTGPGAGSWIAVANPDGSAPVTLAPGDGPAWSPDGTRLAFSNAYCDEYYGAGCSGGLVIMDPETGGLTMPAFGREGQQPSWAPAGDAIAFTICCGVVGGTGPSKIHIAALDGTSSSVLSTPGTEYASHPSWSPDGQKIVFMCVITFRTYDLCTVRRDGTGLVALTNTEAWESRPRWSPDGSTIVFATQAQNSMTIAVVPATGGKITHLGFGMTPTWSPDGKIVFSLGDGLFSMNADGSNVTRIATGSYGSPAWRPPVR